ncbi:MAG: hypothetical protein REI11_11695 [Patulibacter sp.]|nr:hypothetical protein [Patulibacter sp.]
MAIIVPTRSRPQNVTRVVDAWLATDAFAGAELWFVHDADDPQCSEYDDVLEGLEETRGAYGSIHALTLPTWLPLVPKLNAATAHVLEWYPETAIVGFAGDDHLPRTPGWTTHYREILGGFPLGGTGVVYPDDGYRQDIPTSWVMTVDIARELGNAQVPAPVEHLYCDNAVADLADAAGCLAMLPDVLVEHMHPVAGKADRDAQYDRVNSGEQFAKDRRAYRRWKRDVLPRQARRIRALRPGGQEERA